MDLLPLHGGAHSRSGDPVGRRVYLTSHSVHWHKRANAHALVDGGADVGAVELPLGKRDGERVRVVAAAERRCVCWREVTLSEIQAKQS
jgi:hypothetical protein